MSKKSLTGLEIAQEAKKQLAALTGFPVDTISQLQPRAEGWLVNLELIELKRIPEANDVLATYEAHLDSDGGLISYTRIRRYTRDQTMD